MTFTPSQSAGPGFRLPSGKFFLKLCHPCAPLALAYCLKILWVIWKYLGCTIDILSVWGAAECAGPCGVPPRVVPVAGAAPPARGWACTLHRHHPTPLRCRLTLQLCSVHSLFNPQKGHSPGTPLAVLKKYTCSTSECIKFLAFSSCRVVKLCFFDSCQF